ncbi:aldo/keto reductase [Radiobacillus kanasensis]|uniref:aldo/keto reductase n=1 Tax=Radiobacillus kanasensis TaxID=2844358 RepID=UPI001E583D8B|nr:aldo/keto reductase [Radiobacillus kanasensis]UFT98927.1 aldo/keto reductase [Radiobacillus kanasensis]
MKYKTISDTGIHVSELCFGTMSFGGIADKDTSKVMYKTCREAGINFFDTANVYNLGKSEEILGECIQGEREKLVISSKVGFPLSEDPNDRGASRRHILQSIDKTLKRLKTDWIDFYFIHRFDPYTDIKETLRALDYLVQQGKILYPAVSNWAAWQISKALGISEQEGLASFKLIQPMYNLVKRQAEVEILPLAESENLGVISYSPLGGGLLTGKYSSKNKPSTGRLVDQENYKWRYEQESYYHTAERFNNYALDKGYRPASLAIAWVRSHPGITAPIIGARNVEQLQHSLDGVHINLSVEERKKLSDLSPHPGTATDHHQKENML